MTVSRLIELLKAADEDERAQVTDADSYVDDVYAACYENILGVTINNNGSATILFSREITDEMLDEDGE